MSHQKKRPLVILPASPFLLSAEVQTLLRVSKRSLIRYRLGYTKEDGTRVRPIIGFVRRGGRVLFAKTEVDRFISARTRVAA